VTIAQKQFLLAFVPDPACRTTRFDGDFSAVMLLTDLGGDVTQLEYLFRIDLGRAMQAQSLIRTKTAEHAVFVARQLVIHLKLRLLAQRALDSIGDADAAILADALLSKRGSKLRLGQVRVCIGKFGALAELRSRFPWIEPMLVEILCYQLQLSFGQTVATSPSQVTAEQGSHIGKSLALQLVWHGRAAPAIQAWIRQFPALQQLQALHPWVFVMLQRIAAVLLMQASWGIYPRVLFCGLLTYLDLASDLLVTKQYLEHGEVTGATLTLSPTGIWLSFACSS
jgi:hypothetical protein